jgi:hypothetical protein
LLVQRAAGQRKLTVELLEDALNSARAATAAHGHVELVGVSGHFEEDIWQGLVFLCLTGLNWGIGEEQEMSQEGSLNKKATT